MATFTTDPFRELERLMVGNLRAPASTAMPMDIYRKGDTFLAQIDLPGVNPDSIDIDIDDRTLTVRAERTPAKDDDIKWLSRERPAGTFARQLTLGYGLAADRVEADYNDGVLTIKMPVSEESKPRKVTVGHSNTDQVIETNSDEKAKEKPEK
ncbi:MAG: Hsp20/alpha crystallin family protein [Ancrocorticia sp.]|jgi:HSP20 family protein|nr:Hsp20/alpha crystallin family protein [Ancrocorticia sp.]MCI1896553.1 Hsp20/alpha crystallin family protein [Ancrocorticia sp.]MCI1964081.1 Hsp20/alpha crystallin family protein [Ancrocorticia sp.]MCI2001765.1 Hsp20/alpha crystallin family protein [Ancrocorticia sp.]MCI2013506.1 Hsp20/alpha crystallin family protein [Ancrocorticia sp.]